MLLVLMQLQALRQPHTQVDMSADGDGGSRQGTQLQPSSRSSSSSPSSLSSLCHNADLLQRYVDVIIDPDASVFAVEAAALALADSCLQVTAASFCCIAYRLLACQLQYTSLIVFA